MGAKAWDVRDGAPVASLAIPGSPNKDLKTLFKKKNHVAGYPL